LKQDLAKQLKEEKIRLDRDEQQLAQGTDAINYKLADLED